VSKRLLASYLALTAGILITLEVPLALIDQRTQRQDLESSVQRDAFVVASLAEDQLQTGRVEPGLKGVVLRYRAKTGGRIVIVDRTGRSIADSHPTFPGEVDFATRPEIKQALAGKTVSGLRYSHTLGHGLLFVAVPVASGGAVFGAVRITYPTSALDHRVRRDWTTLLIVALLILAGVAAVGVVLARSIAGPLRRVEEAAVRLGSGDLAAAAPEDAGPPEVRRLAVELNRTAAQLAALIASQEQFVADASHELRTPLTALRLRIEAGDEDGALAEVSRLGRLVDELLALARADAAAEPAERIGLDALARGRVAAWEPLATERGVRLRVEADGGAAVVAGAGRAEQIVDNLLSNALEASPRGGEILLRVRGPELHVVDEGRGLGEEDLRRAFDRFWRASRGPGSGLGLPIARRLAQLDGGDVELRAAESGGVDAVLRYPSAV
jgi:signal transduction histidine kinase